MKCQTLLSLKKTLKNNSRMFSAAAVTVALIGLSLPSMILNLIHTYVSFFYWSTLFSIKVSEIGHYITLYNSPLNT